MTQKPRTVEHAVLAIWASFGLFTLIAIIDRQSGAMSSGQFVSALLTYALLCVLPYKIGAGRNWARYVYAIFVALSIALMLAGETKGITKLALVMSYLTLPMQAWILYALFRPTSGEWFAARAQK
jgi:hypothetical protein